MAAASVATSVDGEREGEGDITSLALGEFRLAADRRNGSLYTIVEMASEVGSEGDWGRERNERWSDGGRAASTKKGENKQKPGKRQSVLRPSRTVSSLRPSVRPRERGKIDIDR